MADSLNYILTEVAAADGYTPAATLGPLPDIIDGIDIQIERADAVFQIARGSGPELAWLENREYTMRPGTRFIGNVSGIRFRNANAGSPALVTASLTGPDEPRIGPRIPLPATGVGDPLLQASLATIVSGKILGPFDVGDWPGIILGAQITGGGAGLGARIQAQWATFPGGVNTARSLDVLIPAADIAGGGAQTGLLVVRNVLPQVSLRIDTSGAVAGNVFATPCYLSRNVFAGGSLIVPVGNYLLDAVNVAVNAGATRLFMLPPYPGRIALNFITGASGPYNVFVFGDDFNDSRNGGRLLSNNGNPVAAFTGATLEFAGIAAPMIVSVTNTGGVAGSITLSAQPSEYA